MRHIWYYIESVFPRGRYGTSFAGTGEFITAMGLHFQGTEKFVIGTNENYDVLDDAFKYTEKKNKIMTALQAYDILAISQDAEGKDIACR